MSLHSLLTAIPAGFIWQCDFETSSGASAFCNMEQSTRDTPNYDWQLWTGFTPSQQTGPTFAFNGAYYLYFEASEPFAEGQSARCVYDDVTTRGSRLVFKLNS